jgi:hypothetical protein
MRLASGENKHFGQAPKERRGGPATGSTGLEPEDGHEHESAAGLPLESVGMLNVAAQLDLDPVAYLLGHSNWGRLGPKRQEIAMLLALNEYDPVSNTLSNASNIALEKRYRYSRDQFKNTFAALRALGVARPHEQFEIVASSGRPNDRRRGKYQIATRYTLESTPDGSAWVCAPRRAKLKPKPRVGKLVYTAAEEGSVQGLFRNRVRLP